MLQELLLGLQYFFSFCRGFWSSPTLPVGIDQNGTEVWAEWSARSTTSWRGVKSWFDPHRANLMTETFPGFWNRWNDVLWRETVQRAIYWYIGSNISSGGLEGSIMLSQTALELLAWTLLVKDQKTLSSEGFGKLPAADQIRLLLSRSGVPLALPPELTELEKLSRANNWEDGPVALTRIRNKIVHPGDGTRAKLTNSDALFEVWNLGQWYIELALLRLFGHEGEYGNRLLPKRWAGQVQVVPWAS